MFSVAPLNKSTTLSFTLPPCTYYASNLRKFYLVTSWPHLMQHLRENSPWKTKDMRVEVEISTYPFLSDELPRIHHVSSNENISFGPSTPCTTATSQSHHKPVYCGLSFCSSDNDESSPVHSTMPPQNPMDFSQQWLTTSIPTICDDLKEDKEEEDFQTVALDDDHWTMDEIPDRHLCIHEHLLPHSLCPYQCPYMDYTSTSYHDTLDLSDISEFKDLITTSSDEDIPALDDEIGYWNL